MSNYHRLFYIGKNVLLGLIIVVCLNFVLAEGSWDSFKGNNSSSVVFVENLSNNPIKTGDGVESPDLELLKKSTMENEGSLKYTLYFYVALGVGVVGFLIAVLFIYLFLRRPKNKWEKRSKH